MLHPSCKVFLTRVVPSRRQAVHWIDPVPSRGETGEPLVLTACMYMTIVSKHGGNTCPTCIMKLVS